MRVIQSDNLMTFDKLHPGDVFIYCGLTAMKMKAIQCQDGHSYNCVHLTNGQYDSIEENTPVNYIDAVLHLD